MTSTARETQPRRAFKDERRNEHDVTTYPLEFSQTFGAEMARRIDQILTVTSNATPPRDPDDDDDYEDEDGEDEDHPDEPAVVREPDEN